jgi:hypothetical protein
MNASTSGQMETAAVYRMIALEIVAEALNVALRELRAQVAEGRVNPPAISSAPGQPGFEPTKIDTVMDRLIESRITALAPGAIYCSEELRRSTFLEERQVIAWSDPLDGTTNCFTFFTGFAVVVYFDRYVNGRLDHLAGAIASADGSVVSWQHFRGMGEVWVDFPEELSWPSRGIPSVPVQGQVSTSATSIELVPASLAGSTRFAGTTVPHNGVASRLASVSSTEGRFRDVGKLFDIWHEDATGTNDRTMLSTLAGNPLVCPLLLGQLGSVVEVRAVQLHDAAYLLPLTLLGGHVVDPVDGRQVDVLRAFSEVAPDRRRIGPFVAATSMESIAWLLKRRR